nr:hypothetical protein CFP56_11703 [Quercus suber]
MTMMMPRGTIAWLPPTVQIPCPVTRSCLPWAAGATSWPDVRSSRRWVQGWVAPREVQRRGALRLYDVASAVPLSDSTPPTGRSATSLNGHAAPQKR